MTTSINRPAWTIEFENETIDRLINKYASHIPKKRLQEPKAIATAEEP
ncbi:hypothetical protein H6G94_31990 [Nostoc punctiforme FACHB-252]|uniref:Transposase n=1 Tax=Nostoc punctiforme FACHB-252 TaxID=1357509 RepID=A0ABR8HJV8_NOSPU|nr:hypothetical protein [Nostoc punctiforme]MBD2615818.1 hypothetical protein [Nostoc punctiforme FACHB-252]